MTTDAQPIRKVSLAGAWISVLLGFPLGILLLYLGILVPAAMIGEGLLLFAFFPLIFHPTIALLISFVIILWFAGIKAGKNLEKGQHLIWISFKFSATVNFVMWTTFMAVLVFQIPGVTPVSSIAIPLFMAVIGTIISTFTYGLLICFLIKQRIQNRSKDNFLNGSTDLPQI